VTVHLSDDDLRRWRDGEADADRDRVVGHLAACESCTRRYAFMIRTEAATADEVAAPREFVERGYRAHEGSRRTSWSGWLLRPVTALASIAIVAGALWVWRQQSTSPVYRGGDARIDLLRPADRAAVPPDVTFEWQVQKGGGCRLRVYDAAKPDAPVVDRRAESGTQTSPAERERLTAGISYRWFVECALEEGGTAMSSSRRFSLR
jgi:hypothetical protein